MGVPVDGTRVREENLRRDGTEVSVSREGHALLKELPGKTGTV